MFICNSNLLFEAIKSPHTAPSSTTTETPIPSHLLTLPESIMDSFFALNQLTVRVLDGLLSLTLVNALFPKYTS